MRRRVLIAGGGVGGLESALALRALGRDLVDIEVLAPERHFTYRPLAVAGPFGRGQNLQIEVARIAAERGFHATRDVLDAVLADEQAVLTQDGRQLGYDDLVLSLGALPRVAVAGALTFRGPRDARRVSEALRTLAPGGRVAFIAPAIATWTLPVYELALLATAWAAERNIDIDVRIVTAERSPLEAFGPEATEPVERLLDERGVTVHTSTDARSFENGRVWVPAGTIAADVAVALPMLVGPAVAGVPNDEQGFAPVDDHCRVRGLDHVYAVGDMTTHPVKQGGLAAQQADVAAAVIAADAGAPVRPEPYRPILRGLLLTGGAPLYLRNPPTGELVPSEAGFSALWWPAHKIVGRHLAPYLATHGEMLERVAA